MKDSDHYAWHTLTYMICNPQDIYQNQFSKEFLSLIIFKSLKSMNSTLPHKHSSPCLSARLYLQDFFPEVTNSDCSISFKPFNSTRSNTSHPRWLPITFLPNGNLAFPEDTISYITLSIGRHSLSEIPRIPELLDKETAFLAFHHFWDIIQS